MLRPGSRHGGFEGFFASGSLPSLNQSSLPREAVERTITLLTPAGDPAGGAGSGGGGFIAHAKSHRIRDSGASRTPPGMILAGQSNTVFLAFGDKRGSHGRRSTGC